MERDQGEYDAPFESEWSSDLETFDYTENPNRVTWLLVFALRLAVALSIGVIVVDLLERHLLVKSTVSEEEVEISETLQQLVGITIPTTMSLCFLLFLSWVHCVSTNSHGYGTRGMEFTPNWAVGCFFIPVLLVYQPWQMMQELLKVSEGPATWRDRPNRALVNWWWGLFLTLVFFDVFLASFSEDMGSIEGMLMVNTVSLICDGLLFVLAMVTLELIQVISRNHRKLVLDS